MEEAPAAKKNPRIRLWVIALVVIALTIAADLIKVRLHVERDRQFLVGTWRSSSIEHTFKLELSADGTYTSMGRKGTWTYDGEVLKLHFNGGDDGPTFYLDVSKETLSSHVPDGMVYTKF